MKKPGGCQAKIYLFCNINLLKLLLIASFIKIYMVIEIYTYVMVH